MRKLHFFSTLVALVFATTSLWAKPAVADENGKLPGMFQVACGEYVYFSQANLQYTKSTTTWSFMDEQYSTVETYNQTVGTDYSNQGVVSLFGWGTSGWDNTAADNTSQHFQPFSTCKTDHGTTNNNYQYGPSLANVAADESWSKSDAYKNYDWGVYNKISNGGNQKDLWRTLTIAEWQFLLEQRPNAAYLRTLATVNSVHGLIILPDNWSLPDGQSMSMSYTKYTTNQYSIDDWRVLEAAGAVFLPAAGNRSGTSATTNVGSYGMYWASTAYSSSEARYMFYYSDGSSGHAGGFWRSSRCNGYSVRLIQDVPDELEPERPIASVATPPTAVSGLVYNGSFQTLVTAATGTTGGSVWYEVGSGSWGYSAQARDVGTYTVHWYVRASGNCYVDSDEKSIEVTIARGTASAPGSMPTIEATSFTYNGDPQDLVTATGSLSSGYTLVYSTDGVNWSPTPIPQGTNAGNYTVYYKFYQGDNYEYVPSPNTINASIAQADLDLSGATLPPSTNTIDWTGSEQTLLEIDPIADCTIEYSTDGGANWTTTPPIATDADDYSVQYKIVPSDPNYKTYGPETVTVTIVDYPTITDQTADDATIASILTGLTDPWQLKVKRTIYADGEYNTICLPFALDKDALDASPLAGFNNLKTIKGASVTGSGQALSIDIFVEDVTEMEAGKPYLISYPSAHADIVNPVFQLSSTTSYELHAGSVTADGVTFKGMFAQVHIAPYTNERDEDYLFLGANSQLMWPNNDGSSMRGFRAYFIIDRNAIPAQVAPRGTHARFVNAPKQPTAIENTELNTQAQKLFENGQLIILKNGIKYNAQGQVLK